MDSEGIRGKTVAAKAAWDKAARAKHADLDAVMAAFADVTSPDASKRLALLPKDPRVDAGLVAVCEAAPYRATMTQPFWRALFARLAGVRDAELVARLAAPTLYAGVAASMQAWLKKQTAALVAELQQQQLTSSPKRPKRAAKHDLAALEAAVYANPDDDAPRAVYADALVEAGDPRGEMIQLQLAGDPAKKLVAAHGKTWLGPLAPIVRAGFTFARGFLDACSVNPDKQEQIAKLAGHPMWSTVRAIGGCARISLHPVMRSLRELDYSTFEARRSGMVQPWEELLVTTERPIAALTYQPNSRVWAEDEDPAWGDADELVALTRCAALPALERLTVAGAPALLAAFAGTPLAKRLTQLRFVVPRSPSVARDLVPGLRALSAREIEVEIGDTHPTRLAIGNGAGTMTIAVPATARPSWHDAVAREAIELLQAIDLAWTVDAKPGFKGIASVRRAAGRAPASPARRDSRR